MNKKFSTLKLLVIIMLLQHFGKIDAQVKDKLFTDIIGQIKSILPIDKLIAKINENKSNIKINVNTNVETVKKLLETQKNEMSRVEYSGAINIILEGNLEKFINEYLDGNLSIQIDDKYRTNSFINLPQKIINDKDLDFFIELLDVVDISIVKQIEHIEIEGSVNVALFGLLSKLLCNFFTARNKHNLILYALFGIKECNNSFPQETIDNISINWMIIKNIVEVCPILQEYRILLGKIQNRLDQPIFDVFLKIFLALGVPSEKANILAKNLTDKYSNKDIYLLITAEFHVTQLLRLDKEFVEFKSKHRITGKYWDDFVEVLGNFQSLALIDKITEDVINCSDSIRELSSLLEAKIKSINNILIKKL